LLGTIGFQCPRSFAGRGAGCVHVVNDQHAFCYVAHTRKGALQICPPARGVKAHLRGGLSPSPQRGHSRAAGQFGKPHSQQAAVIEAPFTQSV